MPVKVATLPTWPSQTPVAPAPTIWLSPSAGAAGGTATVRLATVIWTIRSRIFNASLWVTCFCACEGWIRGND